MPRDTPQQRLALRQNRAARIVRERFPEGARVRARSGAGMEGTVLRHVPGHNAQGGYLVIEWDNGATGRHGPIAVERV